MSRGNQWVWVRLLTKDDVQRLRELLVRKNTQCTDWGFKLHRGNILISVPVVPWNPKTGKPDPALRYMNKEFRVVPVGPGPYQLEYMRHTGQWWPISESKGDLPKIAEHIAARLDIL